MSTSSENQKINLDNVLWYELKEDVVQVGYKVYEFGTDFISTSAITYSEFIHLLKNIDKYILSQEIKSRKYEASNFLDYFAKFAKGRGSKKSLAIPYGLVGISKFLDNSGYRHYYEVKSINNEPILRYGNQLIDTGSYIVQIDTEITGSNIELLKEVKVYNLMTTRFNKVLDLDFNPVLTNLMADKLKVGRKMTDISSKTLKEYFKTTDLETVDLVNDELKAVFEEAVRSKQKISW